MQKREIEVSKRELGRYAPKMTKTQEISRKCETWQLWFRKCMWKGTWPRTACKRRVLQRQWRWLRASQTDPLQGCSQVFRRGGGAKVSTKFWNLKSPELIKSGVRGLLMVPRPFPSHIGKIRSAFANYAGWQIKFS